MPFKQFVEPRPRGGVRRKYVNTSLPSPLPQINLIRHSPEEAARRHYTIKTGFKLRKRAVNPRITAPVNTLVYSEVIPERFKWMVNDAIKKKRWTELFARIEKQHLAEEARAQARAPATLAERIAWMQAAVRSEPSTSRGLNQQPAIDLTGEDEPTTDHVDEALRWESGGRRRIKRRIFYFFRCLQDGLVSRPLCTIYCIKNMELDLLKIYKRLMTILKSIVWTRSIISKNI